VTDSRSVDLRDVATAESPHPWERRARLVIIAFVVMCAAGLCFALTDRHPTYVRFPDGRRFQMLNWDRHFRVVLSQSGLPESTTTYFWVRYVSAYHDLDSMSAEARSLAPMLYPVADSLGLVALRVEPMYVQGQVLAYHEWLSAPVDFVRGRGGEWREVSGR